MAFTQEEIKSRSISPFDHLESWASKAEVYSIIRLMEFLPLLESDLLDELVERLEEKEFFKANIKLKLKQAGSYLDTVTKEIYKKYGFDPSKPSLTEFMKDYSFAQDAIQKIGSDIINFMTKVENSTNVSGVMTEEENSLYLIKESTSLYKLEEGDTFFFLDSEGESIEYTFLSLIVDNRSVNVKIKRLSENTEFIEEDGWRPVIKTTLISKESLEYFKNKYDLWKQTNKLEN